MNKFKKITLCIIIFSFITSLLLYSKMPNQMAGHWNLQGQADDYFSKFWGLFLMPIVSIAIFLLFIILPKIDPLKNNITKFKESYNFFILMLTSFLFYLYLLTLLWNLGKEFNMSRAIAPAFGFLFIYLGYFMQNIKPNWFIGFRTPWTLSSEKIWYKTHQRGGMLFKFCGIIALLAVIFPQYAGWLIMAPVITASAYIIIYSYLEYKKQNNNSHI